MVDALAERMATPGAPEELVFAGPQGGRAAGRRCSGARFWRPATRAAGLDGLRIHDLRHTAVALWIAAGANPKEVAARAGHASVSFTLDRYGHLYPEADLTLRERLGRDLVGQRRRISEGLRPQRGPGGSGAAVRTRQRRRDERVDLLVRVVGVTGLEPVTSSL